MPNLVSNRYLIANHNAENDFSSHTFKCCLMAAGFTFNRATHDTYATISPSELPGGNGYVIGGNTLTGVTVTRDDINNYASATTDNSVWTASGGSIGPTPGAIVYNDTHAQKIVCGYIDFGGNLTATDTQNIEVRNIEYRHLG